MWDMQHDMWGVTHKTHMQHTKHVWHDMYVTLDIRHVQIYVWDSTDVACYRYVTCMSDLTRHIYVYRYSGCVCTCMYTERLCMRTSHPPHMHVYAYSHQQPSMLLKQGGKRLSSQQEAAGALHIQHACLWAVQPAVYVCMMYTCSVCMYLLVTHLQSRYWNRSTLSLKKRTIQNWSYLVVINSFLKDTAMMPSTTHRFHNRTSPFS